MSKKARQKSGTGLEKPDASLCHSARQSSDLPSRSSPFPSSCQAAARTANRPAILTILAISLGLIAAPYFRGLYFDQEMAAAAQVTFLLVLVSFIWQWRISLAWGQAQRGSGEGAEKAKKEINGSRQTLLQKGELFFDLRHFAVLLLLLPYLIGLFTAADAYENRIQLFRFITYAFLFILAAEALSREKRLHALLQGAMQVAIGWTALFAVAAALGQVTFRDAVLGNRLSSVFQYPNTFGILLAVAIVGGFLMTVRGKWGWTLLGGLFLVPMAYVFLLTLSRGAWLFFPVIYLLGLLLLPLGRQVRYLIQTIPPLAGTGVLLFRFGADLSGQPAGVVWGWLSAVGLGSLLLQLIIFWVDAVWLVRRASRAGSSIPEVVSASALQWNQWIIPVVLAVLVLAGGLAVLQSKTIQQALPEAIGSRVAGIEAETSSVLSRQSFNEDALDIFREHWLIGAGGGGWEALFQKVQDYPYWSTQSHNFFSQVMVEGGSLGLLLFLAVFLYFLWLGWQVYRTGGGTCGVGQAYYLVVFAGLMGHSLIDFDMAYGFVAILAFLSLAGWQAGYRYVETAQKQRVEVHSASPPAQTKPGNTESRDSQRKSCHASSRAAGDTEGAAAGREDVMRAIRRGFVSSLSLGATAARYARLQPLRWQWPAGVAILLTAFLLIFPVNRYAAAERAYSQVDDLLNAGETQQVVDALQQLIAQNRYQPSYHLTYASVLISVGLNQNDEMLITEARRHLEAAERFAPTDPQVKARIAQQYQRLEEWEPALEKAREALELGTWDINYYQLFMEVAYGAGEARLAQRNALGAREVWIEALAVYERIGPMQAQIDALPETMDSGRPFTANEAMNMASAQLLYRTSQFALAEKRLTLLIESEDQELARLARLWLLAARAQQGADLQADPLYQEMVTGDKGVQREVQAILQLPVL